MSVWDDMLDEFRALGGTAENIQLGQGQFGRGLFPLDPSQPVAIRVPENLLINIQHMVFAEGKLRVGPNARVSDRERAWLDRYQQDYAWGGGGGDEALRTVKAALALPENVRDLLTTKYQMAPWFEGGLEQLVLSRFLNARAITYRDREVLIPVLELANHGAGGCFGVDDGLALKGTFAGEIFSEYSETDSFDFFRSWGFATPCAAAFSMPLTGSIQNVRLQIRKEPPGAAGSSRGWIPSIDKTADTIALPFLLIGHQKFPRLCKGIFYRLMQDAGYSGFEEAFDMVEHKNRMHFLDLIAAVEDIDLPMAQTLRMVAQFQLRAMSFYFGSREP